MKLFVTIFAILSISLPILAWGVDVRKQAIPLGEYDLIEFEIHIASLDSQATVKCSRDEVRKGLRDLMFFGEGRNPGRSLNPSQQPIGRDLAWTFRTDDGGCKSLGPYFNGIGFNSLDLVTGAGEVYIAMFEQIQNLSKVAVRDEGVQFLTAFAPPEFILKNLITHKVQCTYQKSGTLERYFQPDVLYCNLGKSGHVTLEKR